jgi:hypothetical protein
VKKPANKIGPPNRTPIGESVERRASAKKNPDVTPEAGTQRPTGSESWRARIRAVARKDKALYMAITVKKVSYVFDMDIKGFYDATYQRYGCDVLAIMMLEVVVGKVM